MTRKEDIILAIQNNLINEANTNKLGVLKKSTDALRIKQENLDKQLIIDNQLQIKAKEFHKWLDDLGLYSGMDALSELVRGGRVIEEKTTKLDQKIVYSFVTKIQRGKIITGSKEIDTGRKIWENGESMEGYTVKTAGYRKIYERVPIFSKDVQILEDKFSLIITDVNSYGPRSDFDFYLKPFPKKYTEYDHIGSGVFYLSEGDEVIQSIARRCDPPPKSMLLDPKGITLHKDETAESQIAVLDGFLTQCYKFLTTPDLKY